MPVVKCFLFMKRYGIIEGRDDVLIVQSLHNVASPVGSKSKLMTHMLRLMLFGGWNDPAFLNIRYGLLRSIMRVMWQASVPCSFFL